LAQSWRFYTCRIRDIRHPKMARVRVRCLLAAHLPNPDAEWWLFERTVQSKNGQRQARLIWLTRIRVFYIQT
jgi:hypothetical protein